MNGKEFSVAGGLSAVLAGSGERPGVTPDSHGIDLRTLEKAPFVEFFCEARTKDAWLELGRDGKRTDAEIEALELAGQDVRDEFEPDRERRMTKPASVTHEP